MRSKLILYLPYVGFVQALIATVGSLYSETLGLVPCRLCWEQRITMYPLVAIFIVGILRKDKALPIYILPLSVIGMIIALYQNLLIYKLVPEQLAPCTAFISCTEKQGAFLGFLTIPMLSFFAFAIITTSMIIYLKVSNTNKK